MARAAEGKGGLGEDVVTVTLRCVAPSIAGHAPQVKRLPLSLTIRGLKRMCDSLFHLQASKQVLHYRDTIGAARDGPLPEELADDDRTLGYYGVREMADIFVNEADEAGAVKAKEEEMARKEIVMQAQIKAAEERRHQREADVKGAKDAAVKSATAKAAQK